MNIFRIGIAALVLGAVSAPAAAQLLSAKFEFLKAVRERDGNKVNELLRANHVGLVDARGDDGNTPLIISIARSDPDFTGFLINKGANPNLPGRGGDTPLITAARVGFGDAVEWLIGRRVRVDATNRMGETALIVAVQQRQVPIVRVLLNAGADPDKTDSAAGYSARDYARRDTRSRQILQLIEAKKPKIAAGSR